MTEEMSLEERKVIYRARRCLKEIDVYFDPDVKNYYRQADPAEKAMFADLVETGRSRFAGLVYGSL